MDIFLQSRLIEAPYYLKNRDLPLVFLAGPVVGAPNWQVDAAARILSLDSEIYVASPRRQGVDFETADPRFEEQVLWETYHLNMAGRNGVVLFWLVKEEVHLCDRPYGQTSRFELGEWKTKHELYKAKLVVGIHPGFPGGEYIRYRLSMESPDVPLPTTLERTCEEAVRLIKK